MRWTAVAISLGIAWGCQAAEPTRLTGKCNTQAGSRVSLTITDTFMDNLRALAVSDLSRNLDAWLRLWEPQEMTAFTMGGNWFADLDYDARQDVAQIASEIRADPVLRSLGVTAAQVFTPNCTPAVPSNPSAVSGPGPLSMAISEYRNRVLDHYILSTAGEGLAIAAGFAGPGWEATREGFDTVAPNFCARSTAVHRLYGPSVNSHLYTLDPAECGRLRGPGMGWIYEGVAFGAWSATDGECPGGKRAVWRLFNNRADPNYRYVLSDKLALVSEMGLRGWTFQGVAFCINP